MSKYTFKYGVMTGDDFELVENYQTRLLRYINDTDIIRLFTQTSVTETNWGYENWIDGAFCAPYTFFKQLGFKLLPITKRRNQMSSGVGQQMSQRLTRLKFTVKNYGSLVIHNGNDDSKMHPTLRKQQPLESVLTNIDYEFVYIIPTYERFVKLKNLINSIFSQTNNCLIILVDDGSKDVRYKEFNTYNNLVYLKNLTNNGKNGFWKTVNSLLDEMSKYTFKYGVMMNDDFELVENYQTKLLSHINDTDIIRIFTQKNIAPSNWGYENWIDGAFCAPYIFFKQIGFELFPIPKRRNQMSSSGVGQQMSQRLTKLNFTVKNYGSLVIHNGNDDSKMHPTLRKQQPLESDFDNLNEEMKKLTSTQSFVDLLKLKGKVPDSVLLQLPIIINKLNCNSILRLSHFLAHCHYDTNGFNKTRKIDNPNSRHITKRVLSEKVYNHLQILEDKDLIKFSKIIGKNLIDNPSLVSNKYSLAASGYIFNMRNLWVICDYGFDEHITRSLTRRIYGSLNSLSGRYELFKYYYNLLK